MNKVIRVTLGVLGVLVGTVFAILPGSILFLLGGLVLLSVDFPVARKWLKKCQDGMSMGAKKLDRMILNRKLR
ncbi:MAG: hypothetical protein Alis3KO_17870 [Aliiglaciecola sp.]|uniref:tellurium resistance protein TerC n=1 Tax=Aliiglaciecola sp. M165 TaxID=2593649 RepID=UPI00117DC566|nr:tellurium resistance protein TerC [Aliiglaciecola sp. M165]TRY30311.1 tellurium resistance protein TerC [Aliiglaciecola sp. M165]